jgi:hypothetical protein
MFSGRRCIRDLGVRKSGTVRVALRVDERYERAMDDTKLSRSVEGSASSI